mmetsp:Transcript_7183/g.15639  ORF Transcript_7183/g.15639 Transcript_7183/m.15639 type:complete len:637 (-) Transcript_7183:192-2102(-)
MSGPGSGYEILGAVKVKDGLFVGDELAAQDLEFVVANKVTRVINCCSRQVPNHWEPIGVVYLTYSWVDADSQTILDARDVVANEIFRFIEEALEGAESVLIHSVRGQSRSCCVLSAYMMKKYCWGLRKTMEFLSSRRPDLNLKPSFLQQLSGYERRLMGQSKVPFSLDWNWSDADFSRLENEELLLRNTYINSQMGPLAEFHANSSNGGVRKLQWLDGCVDDKLRLEKPSGADRHNLTNCKRDPHGQPMVKCILKKPKGSAPPGRGGTKTPEQSLASRPTTASSENTEALPPAPAAATCSVSLHEAVPTAWGAGGAASDPRGPEQRPYAAARDRTDGACSYGAGSSIGSAFQDMMPTAASAVQAATRPAQSLAEAKGPMDRASSSFYDPPNSFLQQQRGPATNIRDSLSGLPSRRESSEPQGRPGSRDQSPKNSASRHDSPLQSRNESPLRLLRSSGRRPPSPATGGPPPSGAGARYAVPVGPASIGSLGFGIGSLRAGPSGGGPPSGANGLQRGMGAFRGGGPVRAKADLLGDSNRRSRPMTAPNSRPGGGSRPASPLSSQQQRSGSNSRPGSPQQRPPSPGVPASTPPRGGGGSSGYPPVEKKPRMPSSYMRRAPSPTPAFNRSPSPSRPRWRA